MEKTNDVTMKKALAAVSLALAASGGWAHDGREPVHFQGTLQVTSRVELPPQGRCKGPTLKAVGAGDTNLFGSVYVEQSHCLGDDGKFSDGFFKLTKALPSPAAQSVIEGVYCGKLEQTPNSTFLPTTPPTPQGTWLVAGHVCITKTTLGRVDSNCGRPTTCNSLPKGYDPARGISNLTNGLDGPGTIFIDQWIRFR